MTSMHQSTKPGAHKILNSSKQRTEAGYRSGFHATVYDVQRDPSLDNKEIIRDKNVKVFPFVSGASYQGEWKDDKKSGFGTATNADGTKYEGEWKHNKYDGKGTFYVKKRKNYVRQYIGMWRNGKRDGEGTYYYSEHEVYSGEWMNNKRCGNGRLDYANGDYYLGQWNSDMQNGIGSHFHKNGNVFIGYWIDGKKSGPGKFLYASTRKVYEGEWVDNIPKCGEYREPTSDEVSKGTFDRASIRSEIFTLPEVGVERPTQIVDAAIAELRLSNLINKSDASYSVSKDSLDRAKDIFSQLDSSGTGLVQIYALGVFFECFNIQLTPEDMTQILRELEIDEERGGEIPFHIAVDIAVFILGNSADATENDNYENNYSTEAY